MKLGISDVMARVAVIREECDDFDAERAVETAVESVERDVPDEAVETAVEVARAWGEQDA